MKLEDTPGEVQGNYEISFNFPISKFHNFKKLKRNTISFRLYLDLQENMKLQVFIIFIGMMREKLQFINIELVIFSLSVRYNRLLI